jgi:hypothetical protein
MCFNNNFGFPVVNPINAGGSDQSKAIPDMIKVITMPPLVVEIFSDCGRTTKRKIYSHLDYLHVFN